MPEALWATAWHLPVDFFRRGGDNALWRSSLPVIRARESKSAPVGVVGKVFANSGSAGRFPDRTAAYERFLSRRASTRARPIASWLHLESEGYLFRDDAGAYVVGPKLARLGAGIAYHATLRNISRPVLTQLAKETTETVNLAVLDGHDVLYLEVLESPHSFVWLPAGNAPSAKLHGVRQGLAGVSPQLSNAKKSSHVDIRASNSPHHPKSRAF